MPNHEYYIKHRDQILEYSKEYAKNHLEQRREKVKKYRRNHRDKVNAYGRIYYARNREKFKAITSAYYYRNREKINTFRREHYTKDKMPERYERYTQASRYSAAKTHARRKGKEFNISKSDYLELISKKCTYCGGTLPLHGIALDRLDNSKGYVIGNVVSCCTTCNRIRGDHLSFEEMVHIIRCLKEFRLEKILKGVI